MRRNVVELRLPKNFNLKRSDIAERFHNFHKKLRAKRADSLGFEDLEKWEYIIDKKEALKAISRRADALYEAIQSQTPSLTHIKDDKPALIALARDGAAVRGVMSQHRVDEVFAALHEESPWMAPVSRHLWSRMRLTPDRGALFRPLLLVGPPGIGKTHYAQMLATAFGLPSLRLDAPSESHMALGVERGWGSTRPSEIVSLIMREQVANPVVVIDEIDKAGGAAESSKGVGIPGLADRLLSVLEPETARRWRDPSFGLVFDLSAVNFIFTANDISHLPPPFLSRVQIIRLDHLDWPQIVEAIFRAGDGRLSDEAVDMIVEHCADLRRRGRTISLRDVHRMTDAAVAAADRPLVH